MSKRDQNRQQMPEVAKAVDEFREHFEDLKVLYAEEGGIKKGRDPIKERQPRPEFEPEYADENRGRFGGYPESLKK